MDAVSFISVRSDSTVVEITKNISYHQTYTDEAKIREHERKEKIQLKQLEYEEREKKRTVHQKVSGNYVVEIKTSLIVGKTLINSVKFCYDGAELE